MDRETTEFVIYMINEIANTYHLLPSKVYRVLKQTNCIRNYIVPCYDVLHTLDTQYIVADIAKYIQLRGVSL